MGGMGFFLVFFHHPDHEEPTNYTKKKPPLTSISSPHNHKPSSNGLISKTQSTLSICGVLVFTTILLFTLSTFEPTTSSLQHHHHHQPHRRILRQNSDNTNHGFSISRFFSRTYRGNGGHLDPPALQGMGRLFRRGSRAMNDLIVGHVAEDAEEREIATFVRLLFHSGTMSKADLVLVFDSPGSAGRLGLVVRAECDSFAELLELYYGKLNVSSYSSGLGRHGSGLGRYLREVGPDEKEPVWGNKRNSNSSSSGVMTRASYGSVVGFDSSELDPENSLSGFLDRAPMGLRRWACYPMLLGRLRRHFKHTLLLDVGSSLVLSDPFTRVRNRSSDVVLLHPGPEPDPARHTRHKARGEDRADPVDPRVVVGGSRGVRRLAAAALPEIVRAAVERRGKGGRNPVTESGLVSQLVRGGAHLLKNVDVVVQPNPVPEAGALAGFNSLDSAGSGFLAFADYFRVVQRRRGGIDIDKVIRREICSSHELYSSVYRDCLDS